MRFHALSRKLLRDATKPR